MSKASLGKYGDYRLITEEQWEEGASLYSWNEFPAYNDVYDLEKETIKLMRSLVDFLQKYPQDDALKIALSSVVSFFNNEQQKYKKSLNNIDSYCNEIIHCYSDSFNNKPGSNEIVRLFKEVKNMVNL